jgi:zinc transporter ZupT
MYVTVVDYKTKTKLCKYVTLVLTSSLSILNLFVVKLHSGDTAILIAAGWSPLKVAIFQVIAQATAFIGLYIGISVSESSNAAQDWIFAIAAGIFLYVALTDVVRSLLLPWTDLQA